MSQYILALDQGTTSSRAIAFDRSGNIAALSQQSLPQHYPQAGWVEHDPLEIWDTQRRAAAEVIARLPEGSTVTDTRFAAVRQGNRLTVVLKAECLEQIGQTVTLPETETTQR